MNMIHKFPQERADRMRRMLRDARNACLYQADVSALRLKVMRLEAQLASQRDPAALEAIIKQRDKEIKLLQAQISAQADFCEHATRRFHEELTAAQNARRAAEEETLMWREKCRQLGLVDPKEQRAALAAEGLSEELAEIAIRFRNLEL